MPDVERFPYLASDPLLGEASLRPDLPLRLEFQGCVARVSGLLDTGAAVNVMPYRIGVELGAVWDEQRVPLQLTGNLARYDARALLVSATVGEFPPARLVFAWTRSDEAPLLLGQVNFFMEFDVCFHRSRRYFEIRRAPVEGEADR